MTQLHIQLATRALNKGGVIAYPTEAVWGIGCDPSNPDAVQRILEIKRRPYEKGVILVAASLDQLDPWIAPLAASQREQLEQSWPSFQTWIVPASIDTPAWIKGRNMGIALRVSAHPMVSALCQSFGGPIVSTSANPASRPPALNQLQVAKYFGNDLDYVLPGQTGGESKPSTIRDLLTGQIVR